MTFSCADAMAEVENDYKSFELETRAGKSVKLKNLLLLPDAGLKSAMTILGSLDGAKGAGDVSELMPKLRDLLVLVADDTAALKREMADWPVGMAMTVVSAWQEATELGEAQPSEG
ncbi:phage tail assembly protein [Streptomyces antimycoticus]|uniref:phage tail assembly protein n=1 Tax=Streptomyces antimycoticus TaxID=68175 RepID=UPI00341481B5